MTTMQSQLTILGWKSFKGAIDGRDFNTLSAYSTSPLERNDNQSGSAGTTYKCEPSLKEQLSKIDFKEPQKFNATLELRAKSGSNEIWIIGLQPILSK